MAKYGSKQVLSFMKSYDLAKYIISFSPESHASQLNGKLEEWYSILDSVPKKLVKKDEEVLKNFKSAISNLEKAIEIRENIKP